MIHNFTCSNCGEYKSYESDFTTGYARNDRGDKICYACCAEIDRQYMRDNGQIELYLSVDMGRNTTWSFNSRVTNWPGTLAVDNAPVKKGRHNIAGSRYDVWFAFEGDVWHGVTYGDWTQICHCKRTKSKTDLLYLPKMA